MTTQETQRYLELSFNRAQIEELDIGITEGLNVGIYARTDFMPQEMADIRGALSEGIDLSKYIGIDYDWFQLEEIIQGLKFGLPVEKYDDVNIPGSKMHEMRKGLEDFIDLSDFLKYDVAIIREVRNAFADRVDILKYVEEGYDAEQLKAIRTALKYELDIRQYIDIDFGASCIEEIVAGLQENVEVELYAKHCYNWGQMEQLRLGLESQVDITYYSSPLYSRYQMKQIRLGLEDGLAVGEYTSFMYPSYEMARIRREMLGNKASYLNENTSAILGEENRDGLTITVSSDDMTAFICFSSSHFGQTTRKDILRSLRLMGITQNIDPRMLDNLLSGKHLDEVVQIAKGIAPEDGESGYYEFLIDAQKSRTPKILPDGSVDFQNIEWYEQVSKGEILAYYHSAAKGTAGHTVTGKKIPAKKGKELAPLKGKGFYVLEDKKTYVAEFDGKVDVEGIRLEVSRMITVSDVNQTTGNVKFNGNVFVSGTVSDNVTIEASGDVIIDGFVQNCKIVAGGDVILKKGVNGAGEGSIVAGGAIEGKFFERVSLSAVKGIKANYCLHCDVSTEADIMIFGGKGLILGGTIFAARGIKAANVGNELGVRSMIKMGVSDAMTSKLRNYDSQLVDYENKLKILYKGQRDFQDKYPAEVRNTLEVYIKIENAIFTLGQEKEEIQEDREKLLRLIMMTQDAMLTVTGTLYDNIVVDIDGKKIRSTIANNVTVKKIDNRVGIFKNN